jgi:hypothetical protein
MSVEALAKTVSQYAPILGSSLLGPVGGVFGSLIAALFGGAKEDPADLVNKITADPDAAVKLKTLELQHKDNILNIDNKNYATEVDDRKDARAMNITLHDHMPNILALIFIVIYAVMQYHIVNNPGNQDDVISARVQDIFVMIISFYFGSAHGKKKQEEGK